MARTTVQPQDLSLFSTGALADLGGQKLGVKVDGTTISTNGSNQLVAIGGGSVPSTRLINTTAPLTGGGDLSADRTLAITLASSTTNGYLSSTDWNTFHSGGGSTSFANPTATITLAAVNGSASTAMRSDAAPALSSTFSPTMTGVWTHSPTLSGSGGVESAFVISPTISESGTAGYSALRVDITESTVGSGQKFPIEVKVGGVSVFQVTDVGGINLANGQIRTGPFGGLVGNTAQVGTVVLSDEGSQGYVVIAAATNNIPTYLATYPQGGYSTGLTVVPFTAGSARSSGGYTYVLLLTSYAQSGTASSCDLRINRSSTDTLGSGDNLFFDCQVSGVRKLGIDYTGKLYVSNTASATVAVGSLANKWPIYDATGTLLGYIPIYTSIT